MTGFEASQRIAKVLRANGVQDSATTRYGLAYLIENALRHIANKAGAVAIQAGSNANPALKYQESSTRTSHPDPQTSWVQTQTQKEETS
jgi:hypothetical protein